jgi:hypothetical protein
MADIRNGTAQIPDVFSKVPLVLPEFPPPLYRKQIVVFFTISRALIEF